MSLEILEVLPMQAMFILARDEKDDKQVFLRCFVPEQLQINKYMWLTGTMKGDTWIKLTAAECDRLDATMVNKLHEYTEKLAGVLSDTTRSTGGTS